MSGTASSARLLSVMETVDPEGPTWSFKDYSFYFWRSSQFNNFTWMRDDVIGKGKGLWGAVFKWASSRPRHNSSTGAEQAVLACQHFDYKTSERTEARAPCKAGCLVQRGWPSRCPLSSLPSSLPPCIVPQSPQTPAALGQDSTRPDLYMLRYVGKAGKTMCCVEFGTFVMDGQ